VDIHIVIDVDHINFTIADKGLLALHWVYGH